MFGDFGNFLIKYFNFMQHSLASFGNKKWPIETQLLEDNFHIFHECSIVLGFQIVPQNISTFCMSVLELSPFTLSPLSLPTWSLWALFLPLPVYLQNLCGYLYFSKALVENSFLSLMNMKTGHSLFLDSVLYLVLVWVFLLALETILGNSGDAQYTYFL